MSEGIRASAQVEFCSQLGANVRCPKIVTMNFVKETLLNLILDRYWSDTGISTSPVKVSPSTRHEQAVLQHNDDERQLTFRVPSCLALGSGGDLSESLVKEGKCVLLVTRVSPP